MVRYRRGLCFSIYTILSLLVCFGGCKASMLAAQSLYQRDTIFEEVSDYAFFCTIQFHQSAIINGKLYIVGGSIAYTTNTTTNDRTFIPNTYQRSISVKDAFNSLSNDASNYNTMKSYFDMEPLPAEFPELSEGYLWVDTPSAYLVSGHTQSSSATPPNYTTPEKNAVWEFDTTITSTDLSTSWSSFPITPPDGAAIRGFQQGGVFVPGIRQGFLLGGMISRDSDPDLNLGKDVQVAITGLLTFDAETRTWTNESTPNTITPRRRSRMFAVPYGEKGVLLTLGGYGLSPFPFSSIDVYDIANKQWYRQTTTGAIPELRDDFCGVVVSAPDGLSHQIFIFGGALDGNFNGNILSDINVLSIPTFEWFSISSTSFSSPGARQASTCDLYGNRHMLVFGGQKPDESCDATGVFLFDLSDLEWETAYPEEGEAYVVSSPVVNSIGEGESTRLKPVNGFANYQLEKLFNQTVATSSSTASVTAGATRTGSPQSTSTITESSHSRPTGAIAGGVVGGVVVIALGIMAFMFFRRRKKVEGYVDEQEVSKMSEREREREREHLELSADSAVHELDGQKNPGNYHSAQVAYSNTPAELTA